MIIPVKKTLNNAGHIDAKLINFREICPKNPAVFYWLFLGEVSPRNFPLNQPIFLRICPWNPSKFDFFPLKSGEIGRFFCDFWLFFPRKSREIGRFFREFAPENPAKFCFFFREISEALVMASSSNSDYIQMYHTLNYDYNIIVSFPIHMMKDSFFSAKNFTGNRDRGARWKVGGLTIENNFF